MVFLQAMALTSLDPQEAMFEQYQLGELGNMAQEGVSSSSTIGQTSAWGLFRSFFLPRFLSSSFPLFLSFFPQWLHSLSAKLLLSPQFLAFIPLDFLVYILLTILSHIDRVPTLYKKSLRGQAALLQACMSDRVGNNINRNDGTVDLCNRLRKPSKMALSRRKDIHTGKTYYFSFTRQHLCKVPREKLC